MNIVFFYSEYKHCSLLAIEMKNNKYISFNLNRFSCIHKIIILLCLFPSLRKEIVVSLLQNLIITFMMLPFIFGSQRRIFSLMVLLCESQLNSVFAHQDACFFLFLYIFFTLPKRLKICTINYNYDNK